MINKPKPYFGIDCNVFHSSSILAGIAGINMSVENNMLHLLRQTILILFYTGFMLHPILHGRTKNI